MQRPDLLNHPFAKIGLFGHPCHGLVQGGMLTLPNDEAIAYRQPAGDYLFERGTTHLLSVPGVVAPERTIEQQAEDTANGFEWRTSASIVGDGQLYAWPMGTGRWIYVDPAGVRWMVTTTLHHARASDHLAGGTFSLTFRRFGVFGGEPTEVTVDLIVPNLQQSEPVVDYGITWGRIRLFSVHPQGEKAAFIIGVESEWMPHELRATGWLEVSLSGSEESLAATCAVMYTRTQTLGTAPATTLDQFNNRPRTAITTAVFESETGDTGICEPVTITYSADVQTFPTVSSDEDRGRIGVSILTENDTYHFSYFDMIVGVYYKANGIRALITYDQEYQIAINDPPVTGVGTGSRFADVNRQVSGESCVIVGTTWYGSYSVTLSRTSTATCSLITRLNYDGVQRFERTLSVVQVSTNSMTISVDVSNTTATNASRAFNFAFDPGSYAAGAQTWTESFLTLEDNFQPQYSLFLLPKFNYADRLRTLGAIEQFWAWAPVTSGFDADDYGRVGLSLARHANTVMSFVFAKAETPPLLNYEIEYGNQVATPDGLKTVTAPFNETVSKLNFEIVGGTFVYGSYCPMTHVAQVARTPLCWV